MYRPRNAPKVVLSRFDLIPNDQGYIDKLICMDVAKSDINTYEKLYFRTDIDIVWEYYALQRTAEFEAITEKEENTF